MMTPFLLSALIVLQAGAVAPETPSSPAPQELVQLDDYPSDALRRGKDAVISFLMTVDASGKAVDCQVTESSGVAVLDAVPCTNRRRLRFPVAEGAGTREYRSSAIFSLPPSNADNILRISLPLPPQYGGNITEFAVKCLFGPDGVAERCRASMSSGNADLDMAISQAFIGELKIAPPQAAAPVRPMASRIVKVRLIPGLKP